MTCKIKLFGLHWKGFTLYLNRINKKFIQKQNTPHPARFNTTATINQILPFLLKNSFYSYADKLNEAVYLIKHKAMKTNERLEP
jgi:hypothetical protein